MAVAGLLVNLLEQSVNLLEALRDDRHVIDELALDDAAGQVRKAGHHERYKSELAEGPAEQDKRAVEFDYAYLKFKVLLVI